MTSGLSRLVRSHVQLIAIVAVCAGLVGLALAQASGDQYFAFLLGLFATYAIVAVGLGLVVGLIGEISAGHGSLMAIGAYAAVATIGHGFPLACAAAIVAGAAGGALMGLPAVRVSGLGLAIFTWVVGQAVGVIIGTAGIFGGYEGIAFPVPLFLGEPLEGVWLAVLALAVLAIGIVVALRLRSSFVGLAWVAIRENELLASSLSIHASRQRIIAFTVSGAYAGVGGLLLGLLIQYITPDLFALLLSVNLLAMVVVGGRASVVGPVLGAAFVVAIQEYLPARESQSLVAGLLLAALVWIAPGGVIGIWLSVRRRIRPNRRGLDIAQRAQRPT